MKTKTKKKRQENQLSEELLAAKAVRMRGIRRSTLARQTLLQNKKQQKSGEFLLIVIIMINVALLLAKQQKRLISTIVLNTAREIDRQIDRQMPRSSSRGTGQRIFSRLEYSIIIYPSPLILVTCKSVWHTHTQTYRCQNSTIYPLVSFSGQT